MTPFELEDRYSAHNYEPLPVVLTHGAGAHLWDVDGRRYIDMMSAYSAASHGHGHPRILAALEAQARRLAVPSRAYYNDGSGRSWPRCVQAHRARRGVADEYRRGSGRDRDQGRAPMGLPGQGHSA